jgi:16S rRNA processing protein RimM
MRSGGDTPADDTWPSDAVEVGRIVDAFGVQGWIKVQPYAADPQALFSSRRWHLQPPEDPRPKSAPVFPSLLRVVQAKDQGALVVAQVRDVADRDAALALRGGRIFVPRSSFPTAGDGEFYWVDLIGLAVVNRAGEALGTVTGLIDTGVHSVLRVQPEGDGDERLIPFVGAYVDGVDLADKRIRVDWGLDY